MKRILEHIQTYKGCDIMIYKYNETAYDHGITCFERSFCWGNMCWKTIWEAKSEIDKMGA